MMRHRLIYLILALTLMVGLAGMAAREARAQDPTIPTRTPTPGAPPPPPPGPTATDDDNQPNPPPPAPTNTTVPGTTATTTTAATTQATATAAVGGSASLTTTPDTRQSTACDDSPYATAVGVVYVYEGPGGDYNISATLQDGDTRRIVGRAGYADWWVIMLTPTETGWVDDQDVIVNGNTGLAPVIDPPPIGGATPTRGTPWNPTPPPFPTCPATATVTATATSTATPTTTAGATVAAPAATDETAATPAAESAAATTATAEPTTDTALGTGLDPRGAESARADSPTNTMNLILPLAGLALIAGGIVMALMARNRGAKKPDEPQ